MNRWTRKIMMAVSLLAAAAGCAGGRVGIYANMPPPLGRRPLGAARESLPMARWALALKPEAETVGPGLLAGKRGEDGFGKSGRSPAEGTNA